MKWFLSLGVFRVCVYADHFLPIQEQANYHICIGRVREFLPSPIFDILPFRCLPFFRFSCTADVFHSYHWPHHDCLCLSYGGRYQEGASLIWRSSTIVGGGLHQRERSYCHSEYEEQLFWFNTVYRESHWPLRAALNNRGDDRFDSVSEIHILAQYLTKFHSGQGLTPEHLSRKVSALSAAISASLPPGTHTLATRPLNNGVRSTLRIGG